MNNNNKFCCNDMEYYITTNEQDSISYNTITRKYSVPFISGLYHEIWYCPWCGYKLPKSLSKEWELTLLNEEGIAQKILDDYGIESYAEKLIPPEFKTDEWWKKRGL